MYFCIFVKLLYCSVFLKKFSLSIFSNAPLGILFYLIKKVSKKIEPDSNRPRLLFHDRIYFVIASNPAKAGAHFGSYCIAISCLDFPFSASTSLAFIFLSPFYLVFRCFLVYASMISMTCTGQRETACCTADVSTFSWETTTACLPLIAKLFGAVLVQCQHPIHHGWMTTCCWTIVSGVMVVSVHVSKIFVGCVISVVSVGSVTSVLLFWHHQSMVRTVQMPTILARFFRCFIVMEFCICNKTWWVYTKVP